MKPTCGYVNCCCRDCFEVAVCSRPAGSKHMAAHHLCFCCADAGCDPSGNSKCCVDESELVAAESILWQEQQKLMQK